MNLLRELLRRLQYLIHRRQAEKDLEEEMKMHLELRAAERASEGISPSEAAAAAQRQFGNELRLREKSQDVWGWAWLDSLLQDLRYGARALISHKAFTLTAILSLSLGVGANTAVFSIVNAVMLRSLPVREPERLVHVQLNGNGELTNPIWEAIREKQNAFDGAFAYSSTRFDLSEQGEKRPVKGVWISGDYFNVLGVSPHLGRLISPEDDAPGGGKYGAVAVISYGFWQSHFAGETNIIGKTVHLDRAPFQIIGVTPPYFRGIEVDSPFSIAIPIACDPILHTDRSWLKERSTWWLNIVGRLKDDLTPEQGEARLSTVTPQILQQALPDWDAASQKDFLAQRINLRSAAQGSSGLGNEHRTALFASIAVVALVLLIACANIANLLLARAEARQQEISVRIAIGAGRRRLIRQLLTESLLLSLLGLPGGLLLAKWGAKLMVGLVSNPRQMISIDLSMDTRVLLFTGGVALFTGLLFGLAPALKATRISTADVMKQGARGSISGGSRFHLGKALVASQVALSLALLIAAGLFLGSLRNLLNTSLGFDQHNVLAVRVDTLGQVPKEQRIAVFTDVMEQVRRVPGVSSTASSLIMPISGQGWNGILLPDGAVKPDRKDRTHLTWFNRVSPDYFKAMNIPVVKGRDFNARDLLNAPNVVIIGEKTARECFGDTDPIGKVMKAGEDQYEVIGVVRDTKYRNVREDFMRTAFLAMAQDKNPGPGTTLVVRSDITPRALIPTIRAAMMRAHPTLSLEFSVLELRIRETLRTQRLIAILSGIFGALALFLAVIGLYGVTSYAVAQRQAEIGIRMALGAQRSNILWLIFRDVTIILAIGAIAGIAISLGTARYLSSIIYGLSPAEPAILFASAAILGIAGLLAALLPARRATNLDPTTALRQV